MSIIYNSATSWFDLMMLQEDILVQIIERGSDAVKFQRVLRNEQVAKMLTLGDVETMLSITMGDLFRFANGAKIKAFEDAPELDDDSALASGFPVHRTVDARLILDDGRAPLSEILEGASELSPGMVLNVFAPFHPLPLRRVLRRRGFSSSAWPEGDAWRVIFMKRNAA